MVLQCILQGSYSDPVRIVPWAMTPHHHGPALDKLYPHVVGLNHIAIYCLVTSEWIGLAGIGHMG